ncbi:MAG: hypothetical protein ACYSWO_12025 [Planctomycetota bacterium]|jgi:hypothetical protein
MKDEQRDNERIESILVKAHLSEPSAQLRHRVTDQARKAWNRTSADIPWQIPFRRLATAVAAAVLIIWLADFSSDCALARWRSGGRLPLGLQPAAFEELPEMPYGPFPKRLASVDRRPPAIDASALSDYIDNVRKVMDETGDNGVPAPAVRPGGSSLLGPDRVKSLSYTWRVPNEVTNVIAKERSDCGNLDSCAVTSVRFLRSEAKQSQSWG